MFKPKILDTLKNYNKQQFLKDIIADIIVGIVALPLAIAFAINVKNLKMFYKYAGTIKYN